MTMHDAQNNDHDAADDLGAPKLLIEALRQQKASLVDVPAEMDRAILEQARKQLAAAQAETVSLIGPGKADRRTIPFPGSWVRFAAAAAVALLGALIWFRIEPSSRQAQITLDEPTVIDAFLLARKVESGESLPVKFDLNSDGQVNELDATVLAQRAVRLPEGGAM